MRKITLAILAIAAIATAQSPLAGDPLVTTYQYNNERSLDGFTTSIGGSPFLQRGYGYDPRHAISRETDFHRRQLRSLYQYAPTGLLDQAGYQVLPGQSILDAFRIHDYSFDVVRNRVGMNQFVDGRPSYFGPTAVIPGNRYRTYNGKPITYNRAGGVEIDQRGRRLFYDHNQRLVRVEHGADVVTYGYDPLGRKVKRTANGVTKYLWYDDWSLIEETDAAGNVELEVVNGQSIDEIIGYRRDGHSYRPVQDRQNTVLGIVDDTGTLVEAYEYDAYGNFRVHHQQAVEQIRFGDQRLVVRFTGEIGQSTLDAISLMPPIAGRWTVTDDGREAAFLPDDGDDRDLDPDWLDRDYTLDLPQSARDAFGLQLNDRATATFTGADLADRVLGDWACPTVLRIGQDQNLTIEIVFSEPIGDQDLATAFVLTEADSSYPIPIVVTRSPDRLSALIAPQEPETPDVDYHITIATDGVRDLANKSVEALSWTFAHHEHGTRIFDSEINTVAASSFGNRWFFQGHELDPVTGLYDFRNRWYDPELGRFLTRDPMGYPDGPNAYLGFRGSPTNDADPFGLDASGITVTPDGATALRSLSGDEFVNQLRRSGVSPNQWGHYMAGAGYTGTELNRSRAFVQQLAGDLDPVEDALLLASIPIAGTAVAIAGPELLAIAGRSAVAANNASFALLNLGARVAPGTLGAMTGSAATGFYLAMTDAPIARPVLAAGRGLGGHRLMDRLVGETQGAMAQADRILRAGGSGRTVWGTLFQRAAGSGTKFEFFARRNAIHQISERLLGQNRYVMDAQSSGIAIKMNLGSQLGARSRSGRLLRPDIQIGFPNQTWGIIDITTAGAVGKVEKYLHTADPHRTPFLIDVFDEVH